jgi:thiamine pyrophosphate-dependent acetolactate synthase large subunit-like protein
MTDIEKLAHKLKEHQYEIVFGITGSGPSYLLIKALTDCGIQYVTVSNESVAAVAAGTYTYHFGKKALCISIKGPGFANTLSGIIACYFERFNLLSISEDYASNSSHEAMHKRLDQVEIISPIVSKISSLSHLNFIDTFLIDDEINPSPKHFELANVTIDKPQISLEILKGQENTLKDIISKITNSKRPVLICGSLLYRLGWQTKVNELKLPIFSTVQAKGIIDETSANSLGIYTGVGEELVPENEIINQSDCIITIGLKNQEILGVGNKKEFINLDISTRIEFENTHYFSLDQIKEILELLKSQSNWASEEIQKYRRILDEYVKSYSWMPGNAFQSINKLNGKMTMVLDTGFFCTVGEHVYLANQSKRFMGSSNGRNMGLSVPMSLGIAIKNEAVVCCFGDGGIRYHLGDIRTIIEKKLPVCFILFSDGIYGSVASYVGTEILNEELTKPAGIDWMPFFSALNVQSKVVDNQSDFESFLINWDMKSPLFINAKFNKVIYREMTKKLRK